jgi:hypothetical protein
MEKGHRQTYRKSTNSKELMTFGLFKSDKRENIILRFGTRRAVLGRKCGNTRSASQQTYCRLLKCREHTTVSTLHTYYIYSRSILEDVFVPGLYNTVLFGFFFQVYSRAPVKIFSKTPGTR